MKEFLSLNSFSVRLLLGFMVLIGLTTLSAGVPAYWLTRSQLERQAWSQVASAQVATQSLLAAEQERLNDQLVLFSERPTLQQLTRSQTADELQLYLQDFQNQSGLDILLLCTVDGALLAGNNGFTRCPAAESEGVALLDGRPTILARQVVMDQQSERPLGTAVAGRWLENGLLQYLSAATGTRQSIVQVDGRRLSSNFTTTGTMAPVTAVSSLPTAPDNGQVLSLGSDVYYTAYMPLTDGTGQTTLISEVALQVNDLVTTGNQAFTIMAISTLTVAFLGFLVSFWFVRQVNAPLQKLTATAEKISQGNLVAAIPLFSSPVEIRTLAAALHRSQASMLSALQEKSEVGERLNALVQSLVEGVVTYDAEGKVTFWSEGAHGILGWTPAEAEGRHVNELFPLSEDGARDFLDFMPHASQKKQIEVLTQSGKKVVLAMTDSQLIPPGSDTVQVALVFRDVTEEVAVRRLRSYFLANISHEFRTPLSTLIASLELLLAEQENYTLDEVRQLLRPSHVSLLNLQTLIDNLLESSSIEAGQFALRFRAFHIHEAIENGINIARPLLERRNQTLSLAESPHLPEIEGDPARLTQVMVNLIINASKYSPIGQPIELQLAQRNEKLFVAVGDRGPGIPQAERGNLFRSFVRLGSGDQEQYGIGLGLYVVKTIIESHGGQVGISDRPRGGSLFWFEIPFRQKDGV
ncbi:MAG: PAS domain S-box protein [Anaerolineaceae bacterium]|nr:PAS domain S-box protein [Anaerolineaceae bacterium]